MSGRKRDRPKHGSRTLAEGNRSSEENESLEEKLARAVTSGNIPLANIVVQIIKRNETFHSACWEEMLRFASEHGQKRMVQLLLQCSFDVDGKDKDGNTAFLLAVLKRFYDIAVILKQHGADVNATNNDGDTALLLCVDISNIWLLDFLLVNSNADVNIKNRKGNTALMKAIETLDFEAIEMLIRNPNLDRTSRNINGDTAEIMAEMVGVSELFNLFLLASKIGVSSLEVAIVQGKQHLVKFLLKGCLAREWYDKGRTGSQCNDPLKTSLMSTDVDIEMVKMILNAGEPFCNLNRHNINSVALAAEAESYETVKLLLDHGASVDTVDPDTGVTALMVAARKGQTDILDLLMARNADINLKTRKEGSTSLSLAMVNCKFECVRRLVDSGAEVDSRIYTEAMKYGNSETLHLLDIKSVFPNLTLHRQEVEANIEVAKYLINNGADVDALDSEQGTPLIHAIQKHNLGLIQLLLEHGANVDMITPKRDFALLVAVLWGHQDIVTLLIDHGADINLKLGRGPSALAAAVKKGDSTMVRTLMTNGADANLIISTSDETCLHLAAEIGNNLEIIELLLTSTKDINCIDYYGQTALLKSVKKGSVPIMKTLLDHGADVNVQDVNGVTALIKAIDSCNFSAVNLLVNSRADTNLKRADGMTAVHLVCMSKSDNEFLIPVLEDLIQHGADVQPRTAEGYSALHLVVMNTLRPQVQTDLSLLLLKAGLDVNVVNRDNVTPVYMAAGLNIPHVLHFFIDYGANLNITNPTDGNILDNVLAHYRTGTNYCDTVNILFEAGIKPSKDVPDSTFHKLIIDGKEETVFLLARNGKAPSCVHIEDTDALSHHSGLLYLKQSSPLQTALMKGNLSIAARFVQNWYVTPGDMSLNRRYLKYLRSTRCLTNDKKCVKFYRRQFSEPAKLSLLSFAVASPLFGSGESRQKLIQKSGLPASIKRRLNFVDLKKMKEAEKKSVETSEEESAQQRQHHIPMSIGLDDMD